VLDVIPKNCKMKVLCANPRGTYAARAQRFGREYPNFATRKFKHLDDRFLLVDDSAFILGPSIKDAASNSPALVVALGSKEKNLLHSFLLNSGARRDSCHTAAGEGARATKIFAGGERGPGEGAGTHRFLWGSDVRSTLPK
jgi:hypothetical protein